MIAESASDENLRTSELVTIERIVNHLPVFADFDQSRIPEISELVLELFADEDGLDELFSILKAKMPEKLYQTAYALACDVAAADGKLQEVEIALLQEMRYQFGIPRLDAVAIERAAAVRHTTF
ncbi:tellurite resistance TerB family protein [Palleronia caenipelagi]|nr:tellurite resistance TerB family protein [Palleronia caenipelagi]